MWRDHKGEVEREGGANMRKKEKEKEIWFLNVGALVVEAFAIVDWGEEEKREEQEKEKQNSYISFC